MSKPTILVIDDEIPRIKILKKQLGEDFKLLITEDADKALSILKKDKVNLIVTEVLDVEFDKWLAKVNLYDIPVFVLTEKSDIKLVNQLKKTSLVEACFLKQYNSLDYIIKKIKEKLKHKNT